MKLKLTNFRCHENAEFDFGEKGIVLISGDSGAGKSSIVMAINFVLFGGKKVVTYGKTTCRVELEFQNLKITRSNGRNKLIVRETEPKSGKPIEYEGESAQEVINNKFGKTFELTSYISQGATNSFIMMSPSEKSCFLEAFAFKKQDITKIKKRSQEWIREKNDQLNRTIGELETMVRMMLEVQEPKKIDYPLKPTKNKEIAMKNEETKLKNADKKLYKLSNKLEKYKGEDRATELLETKLNHKLESLKTVNTKLEKIILEREKINYKGDSYLQELEDKVNIIRQEIELVDLETDCKKSSQQLQDSIQEEDEQKRIDIAKIDNELWKKGNPKKINEDILRHKSLLTISRELTGCEEILMLNQINKLDQESQKSELEKLTLQLESKKELLTKLNMQKKV